MSNSHRRSHGKSDGALEFAGAQAIMLDGLQMQSNRLKVLRNLAQASSIRQSRLDGAASDIVGSIRTVQSKMDSLQQQRGKALSQREQALLNQQSEQENDDRPHGANAAAKLRTAIICRRRTGANQTNATTSSTETTGRAANSYGATVSS